MICNYPIDVISMFRSDGMIQPLRFRIPDSSQELIRVDVDKVLNVKNVTVVGIESQIFLCLCRMDNYTRTMELKYDFRTHSWKLSKIVL